VDLCWDDATDHLLALATFDLEDGLPPRPTLVGYAGDAPVALVGLRPFGPGEVTGVLAELLGLVVPLGVDRVALALPGRAWSLDDPIPPVVGDLDLRRTVLTVLTADGHDGVPARLDGWLVPYDRDALGAPRWGDGQHVGPPDGPATEVLRGLAAARGGRPGTSPAAPATADTVVRFARCVLAGHAISLAPEVADRLAQVEVTTVR
jgi:hypothetical protein